VCGRGRKGAFEKTRRRRSFDLRARPKGERDRSGRMERFLPLPVEGKRLCPSPPQRGGDRPPLENKPGTRGGRRGGGNCLEAGGQKNEKKKTYV